MKEIKYVNENKTLKKLNVNKLRAMLNAKQDTKTLSKSNSRKLDTSLSLRERMFARLKASRFRFINEQLYSSDSFESKTPKDHVIADFGCVEAKLADSVFQTVYSFDLVAVNEKVQACDMANTLLLTEGVNTVVFCLSLMRSNLILLY